MLYRGTLLEEKVLCRTLKGSITLLEKRVHWGSMWSTGFFTQLQKAFYAKKRFYNDKKEGSL